MAGALPGPATALALQMHSLSPAEVPVVALGKAAHEMMAAAERHFRARGTPIPRGLVVSTHEGPSLPAVEQLIGDHPLPGRRSARAARRVGEFVRDCGGDVVLVLLSGGTSSLVGAPVRGVTVADYRALCTALLGSGLDIVAMNAVRKRFSRWGAGRLAGALRPRHVECLALSDVPGDDVAAIGSGPCVPDALTAADVRRIVTEAALALPPSCEAYLARVERGEARETPKPGDRGSRLAQTRVIVGGDTVLRAPAHLATSLGYKVWVRDEPISGDAAERGRRIGGELLMSAAGFRQSDALCVLWRGETTVRLSGGEPPGGRCQELALAAAETLREWPRRIVLVAAGTDGRDGPTDAAGACVDSTTWEAIRSAGIDPADALARHASHAALDAAGCLVRTGPTGTNVGDVVVALIGPASSTQPLR